MSVHVPSLIVSNSFLMYCFPWFAILPSSPPQLQGPVLVCIALAYPSLVDPTCGPSMPRGGSDDTYFLQINPKFLFLLFTFRICAAVTQKWNPPPPHNGDLHVLRIWDAAHCTSWTSHPPDIGYSLHPISGPCSFSKFIACCITCRGNGIGSFSLISPAISLLNSKVSLSLPRYMWFCGASVSPTKLLSWAFLYSLLWFYPFPTAAFPCGNILFPFVLSILAPGVVNFYIPCNIPSLHPPGVLSQLSYPICCFPPF